MFENLLNPVFSPLLNIGIFWTILILSFVLTLMITLIYKYVTNQTLMKSLKKEMKDLQAEVKKHRNNPKKSMALQKKMMNKNMSYMKQSFKPTLYTFIPIIIIFGWLNAHLAYLPIQPDTQFMVSAEFKEGSFGDVSLEVIPELTIISDAIQTVGDDYTAHWTLSGPEGAYELRFTFGNREYTKDLIISSNHDYTQPVKVIKDSEIKQLVIHNDAVKPLGNFSLFGWKPGWLGTYIILSLIFSFGLRKLMNIS